MSPEEFRGCLPSNNFTSSGYFSRQKDLHIRSGCNERYFRRPGNLQIKNRSFALFYGSSGDLGNMAISMSKLSLAPFSKIHICSESSLCVDSWITLVPKDTIKNWCFDVASFHRGSGVTSFRHVEATLLKDISRKIFSGASVERIRHYILLARVFMYILVVLCSTFSAMVDLGVIPKIFDHT